MSVYLRLICFAGGIFLLSVTGFEEAFAQSAPNPDSPSVRTSH